MEGRSRSRFPTCEKRDTRVAVEIDEFLKAAVRATVFVSPCDLGLTDEELTEVAKQAGYRPGQISDAIGRVWRSRPWGKTRLLPTKDGARSFSNFNFAWQPDPRNVQAFEFARRELQELADEHGEAQAELDRRVLVDRAVAAGVSRGDAEIAITGLVLDEIFQEKDGRVRHAPDRLRSSRPSEQIERAGSRYPVEAKHLAKAIPLVRDIVLRRTDGRPSKVEPLDAFEDVFASVPDSARFKTWWIQVRAELRSLDDVRHPTATIVLAAAMAEGALSFVVPLAKSKGLMGRIDADKPRRWYLDDLVGGAKSGKPDVPSMVGDPMQARVLHLHKLRQRIHVGALIEQTPQGPIPDIRPEEARDARHTLDLLLREILVWLGSSS